MSDSDPQLDTPDPPLRSDDYFPKARKKIGPTFQLPLAPSPLKFYYPEEVIRIVGPRNAPTDRIPNTPPGFQANTVSLLELVGHPLPHHHYECCLDPVSTTSDDTGINRSATCSESSQQCNLFLYYVHQLMNAARRYNRALYRSRRARFIIDASGIPVTNIPSDLLDGKPELQFPDNLPENQWRSVCLLIDNEFEEAAIEFNKWLLGRDTSTTPHQYLPIPGRKFHYFEFHGHVDVVDSNGYIVSIKIAADINPTMHTHPVNSFMQPGYQSSSHYSLSSKYSAP